METSVDSLELTPIALYHSDVLNPYEAARQPRADDPRIGRIRFSNPLSTEELEVFRGCERIWLIFQFHENHHWKPMVRPPRGPDRKIGVFATRAPYRPNSIGLSCVRLIAAGESLLEVQGADLLDGTPILEVKPYVVETDARPDARTGWLEGLNESAYRIEWTAPARQKLNFLLENGVTQIEDFAIQQLEYAPFDERRKRVSQKGPFFVLAYRTWRLSFREIAPHSLEIFDLKSGYSEEDLANPEDRWHDKTLHRKYLIAFP